MSKKETAEAFLAKINVLDIQGAAQYCTDDFTYSGPFPNPMRVQEWAGSAEIFQKAFPDWNFNAVFDREEAEMVYITAHVTGTHTGDLDLSAQGMAMVPATGKSVSLPVTSGRLTFREDKIANYHIDIVEGGGIPGILAQLGVSKPGG